MKVKLAFYPSRFRVPQVCSRCAENPPQGYDEIKVMEFTDWSGKRWNTWAFKFPYCYSCFEDLKQRKIFKGKVRAVDVSNVMTKKYGKFLRKKKLPYVIFEFKNDKFGELFKQANQDILFDRVLSELEAKEK
ncbi:MAG: hypothetical protein ACE5OW_04300 [Candidatus Bathyarchaeia archaeon]